MGILQLSHSDVVNCMLRYKIHSSTSDLAQAHSVCNACAGNMLHDRYMQKTCAGRQADRQMDTTT